MFSESGNKACLQKIINEIFLTSAEVGIVVLLPSDISANMFPPPKIQAGQGRIFFTIGRNVANTDIPCVLLPDLL
jgi:hypothetical protein